MIDLTFPCTRPCGRSSVRCSPRRGTSPADRRTLWRWAVVFGEERPRDYC